MKDLYNFHLTEDIGEWNYYRVCLASPEINLAGVEENLKLLKKEMKKAEDLGADLTVFPALTLTGVTCGDLIYENYLLASCTRSLLDLIKYSESLTSQFIVSLPLRIKGKLVNAGLLIQQGQVKDLYYQPIADPSPLLLDLDLVESKRSPSPIRIVLTQTPEQLGKNDFLNQAFAGLSRNQHQALLYLAPGYGESSSRAIYAGRRKVWENGDLLAESEIFNSDLLICDLDKELLRNEFLAKETASDLPGLSLNWTASEKLTETEREEWFRQLGLSPGKQNLSISPERKQERRILYRKIDPSPYFPSAWSETEKATRCEEILNLTAMALARRLKHLNQPKLILGLSGGLDSTCALIIGLRALASLGLAEDQLLTYSLPGLASSNRTMDQANLLAEMAGSRHQVISIKSAVEQHFEDIGHDITIQDLTYENSQARERTQILMDLANKEGGIVLGTGDLSEIALGFSTYNADHMSMYNVNANIPKTVMRELVSYQANLLRQAGRQDFAQLLDAIVSTPVSPELVSQEKGEISQITEDIVGPYELHDFFIYYLVRYKFCAFKIGFLAKQAWQEKYSDAEIDHWLNVFFKRFIRSQYKRNCSPDSPSFASVSLNHYDWTMPSDISSKLWDDIWN